MEMEKLGKGLSALGCLLVACLLGCGRGDVEVTNTSYEPKIAIEGWLMPHHKVENIKISRNFRLNAHLRTYDLIPDDLRAKIIEESTGREFPLTFQPAPLFDDNHFAYEGDDLTIEYGQTYTLDVTGTVDYRKLHAWASTTVPERGFGITGSNFEELPYRPLDENGDPINFKISIDRSPGTTFYLATVKPLEASSANFVYDNPFTDLTPKEVDEDIGDFDYHYNWIQNTPVGPGRSTVQTFWFVLWFYTRYEIVIFAADANYRSFLQTYDEVQEEDGNFHEPEFAVEGDGIGVFGSVGPDTIYVEVVRE